MHSVTSLSVRDETLARVVVKLHPLEGAQRHRIAVTRFAQNGGLNTLRRAFAPLSMKIFSLPKVATQSPRNAFAGWSRD
ncbi:hypothetical protein [Bradyrhizobium sp.]|uniref:hypothetical protein n=1 Tax=Bradyrhizobium sp. TaxID=376 RepID=UPI0039E2C49D